jgi:hypothetical protein
VRGRLLSLAAGAIALVLSACTAGSSPVTTLPILTPSAPSMSQAATSPAPPTPAMVADTSEFSQQAGAAIAAAQLVPLDGLAQSAPVRSDCWRISPEGAEPATRSCMAVFPASQPMVMITVTSANSRGVSNWMMVYAEMPDGIEGTVLSQPKLGDEARLSRTWGALGCGAVQATRTGTLVVSVRVLLAPGNATADCGMLPPTAYLDAVSRGLIDTLGPTFASVGLPVDDLAARDRAVQLIVSGKLVPGEGDNLTLPADFARLSDTGEVVAQHKGADWTIVFFEFRGVVDHYSGWVFTSTGMLGPDEDPLGGGSAIVKRINAHWFHVVTN